MRNSNNSADGRDLWQKLNTLKTITPKNDFNPTTQKSFFLNARHYVGLRLLKVKMNINLPIQIHRFFCGV
jgi:hypothetical protein